MKQTERDSNKRIAFPIQLFGEGSTDAQVPSEIHVVPTGKWNHPVYGEMEITTAHIKEFVQNFKDKVRLNIPITAGHDRGFSEVTRLPNETQEEFDKRVAAMAEMAQIERYAEETDEAYEKRKMSM